VRPGKAFEGDPSNGTEWVVSVLIGLGRQSKPESGPRKEWGGRGRALVEEREESGS